jgi:RNA polymerase sigma-70 factor (ECF subfamily)
VEDRNDAAIVACVLAGDVDAYAVLVTRHRPRMARYAVRMLGNRDDAQEALQDAFVRAYRALGRCDDPERFGSWLFSILVNRCRTTGARSTRRARTFVTDDVAARAASQNHPAEQAAWREEIDRALDQLDPDQREAFLLKHVEGLSYDEMADVTGVGVSALKMRVKRACDRLRGLLQEAYSA